MSLISHVKSRNAAALRRQWGCVAQCQLPSGAGAGRWIWPIFALSMRGICEVDCRPKVTLRIAGLLFPTQLWGPMPASFRRGGKSCYLEKFIAPSAAPEPVAALAHSHGLLYLFHSCGRCEPVMEDLIEDVRIDAKHSFEDEVTPVGEFCRRYGDRVGALGGVDVDKLCRLGEADLRRYVRGILDECMPGRYALGTGNSVANYIPLDSYLTMLDEGRLYTA